MIIDGSTGHLLSYEVDGRELLARDADTAALSNALAIQPDGTFGEGAPSLDQLPTEAVARASAVAAGRPFSRDTYAPLPNWWRPPTDNDLAAQMLARQGAYRTAGIELVWDGSDAVEVGSSRGYRTYYRLPGLRDARLTTTYLLHADGALGVEYDYRPAPGLPEPPRIGSQWVVDSSYRHVTYLGRGPGETYADKQTGMAWGRYGFDVVDDYVAYPKPQESGNRTDVTRWEMRDDTGAGFVIETTGRPLEASAWPYGMADVEAAEHLHDLEPRPFLTLNLDYGQRGVGGDNTWNLEAAPHDGYRVASEPATWGFVISALP